MVLINTIEYNVKFYQVKATIVNFMDVQLTGLKILNAHIRYFGIYDMYVEHL